MLTAAIAEIECVPGDIAANLMLHRAAIDAARTQGADVLVFPELSLTDYLAAPDCAALGLRETDRVFRMLADAADGIAVSFGFIEHGDDGRFYNTQALVKDGRTLRLHRKLNIPTYGNLSEGRFFKPGHDLSPAVDVAGWRAATLICADLWNPALPWLAALGGADLLIAPVASALDAVGDEFDNPAGWSVVLRHTALLYGLPVLFANHRGTRGGLRFWGGSRIVDPFGGVLAQTEAGGGMIIAALDLGALRHARTLLPTMRNANPLLIGAELEKALASRQTLSTI